jgi:alkylation response protein AidB-like acyl-CoA dehydrogenase
VDPELSGDQELLRDTTRRFLENECSMPTVRGLEHHPDGFDAEWWRRGTELGWTALLVAERDGGGSVSGAGMLDAALVAEELGRAVAPGPFLPTNVVGAALSRVGSEDQRNDILPQLVNGDAVAAWCLSPASAAWCHQRLTVEVARLGDRVVIDGSCAPVEAGAQADVLLVTGRSADGVTQVIVPADAAGVTVVPLESIDLVKRFATVRFDQVELPVGSVLGAIDEAADELERQLQVAVSLQCAETVGAIDEVFAFTLEYVGDRYSFGRPLASYQALKHRFADMKVWLEACHGTASAAARAIEQGDGDAAEIVSAAKSYIGTHATEIVQDCVQMHGGIGVTWEHDIHLYLRRVALNRNLYGSPIEHRARIAGFLGMGGSHG